MFEMRVETEFFPAGSTYGQLVRRWFRDERQLPCVLVREAGRDVPRMLWTARPKPGAVVEISLVPGDGNGLRTLLMVAVTAAAVGTTVATGGALGPVWAPVLGASVSVLGSMAVNALVPVEPPQLAGQTDHKSSPTYNITGGENTARFGQPVRKIYGKARVWPDLAAPWYTSIQGEDTYLHGLLDVGWAPLQIDQLKIGEVAFEDWQDFEWEILDGMSPDVQTTTIYPCNVVEDSGQQQRLHNEDDYVTRTTAPLTRRFSVDTGFIRGLIGYGKNTGDPQGADVDFAIRWRKAAMTGRPDPGDWEGSDGWTEHGKDGTPLRRTSPVFDAGSEDTWDVQVKRLTEDRDDSTGATSGMPHHVDECQWEVLRSFNDRPPVRLPGVARLAIKIRATGQHEGVISKVNCIATAIYPEWNQALGTWVSTPSENMAAAFREALQGNGVLQKVDDSGIDLPGLADWSSWCQSQGFTVSFVEERAMSTLEVLKVLAATGRASPTCPDGVWTVAVDRPKTVQVQQYGPRNSKAIRWRRVLPVQPHALRIRFVDSTNGYKSDSYRTVYADGYGSADMVEADATLQLATEIVDWEMPGVVDPDLIHRHGRKRLAEMELRPETLQIDTDFEGWISQRGHWIQATYDVVEMGTLQARIASIDVRSGQVYGLDLDEPVFLDGSTPQGVRVRLRNASGWSGAIVNFAGDRTHLDLTVPVDQTVGVIGGTAVVIGPLVGDIVTIGPLAQVTGDFLVIGVRRGERMACTIEAQPLAPAVHTAEIGPIPAWAPVLAQPAGSVAPYIYDVSSDELALHRDTDGTLRVAAVVSFRRTGLPLDKYDVVRVTWQEQGTGRAAQHQDFPANSAKVRLPDVRLGETYTIVAQYHVISRLGGGYGPPSAAWTHRIVGANLPPPDVQTPYLAGDRVAWQFESATPDHDGYLVKSSQDPNADWDDVSAVLLSDGPLLANYVLLIELPDTASVVMVKAHTRAGQESVNAAKLSVAGLPRPTGVEVYAEDLASEGFPGTLTGLSAPEDVYLDVTGFADYLTLEDGSFLVIEQDVATSIGGAVVSGGTLQGLDTSAWLGPASQPWLEPATAPWLAASFDSFLYAAQVACPATSQPGDWIVLDIDADNVEITFRWLSSEIVRGTRDDPLLPRTDPLQPRWVPIFSYLSGVDSDNPFRPYSNGLRPQPGQVLELRFFGRGGALLRPIIRRLRVTVQGPLQTQPFSSFQVQPGGSQVLLPSWYRKVQYALGNLALPSQATQLTPLDLDAPGGPTWIAYDNNGNTVPALIKSGIVGYA